MYFLKIISLKFITLVQLAQLRLQPNTFFFLKYMRLHYSGGIGTLVGFCLKKMKRSASLKGGRCKLALLTVLF